MLGCGGRGEKFVGEWGNDVGQVRKGVGVGEKCGKR